VASVSFHHESQTKIQETETRTEEIAKAEQDFNPL